MSAGYRLFIKVHHGFPEHRKTVELSDRAFRKLIELWCLSSRNLTDGILTKAQLNREGITPKILRELIVWGWIDEHEDGYRLANYLEYQMSAQDVSDLQKKRAEAGAKGGKAKATGLASATASASPLPEQSASKPVPDIDIEVDVEEKPRARARHEYPDDYEEFYRSFPRREGKDVALRAWRAAIKRADVADIMAGAKRYADARRGKDPKYHKTPAAWLNGGHWQDEHETEPARLSFGGGDTPIWEMQ